MKFKIQSSVLSILIVLAILLATILYQVSDANNMQRLFLKHGNFSEIPVDEAWAGKIAKNVTCYLSGIQKYMQIEYVGESGKASLFTQKELSHMEDVKNLVSIAQFVFLLFTTLIIAIIYKIKEFSFKYFMLGLLSIALLAIFLVIFFNKNFDKAFIIMHKLLFTNYNWLLTPGEDVIISLMPTAYFKNAFDIIAQHFTIAFVSINFIVLMLIKKIKK
ncbi:MAG: TIGR01906 family membrane protein [Christensenellaceae bacterium]|nr:TIGR01906 family membrane protein [Christensenellaceae bacterium]